MRQRTLRCGELDGTQTKSGDGGKRVQIVAGAAFSSGASDLGSLLQILLGDPAKALIEDDDAVPLGAFAALARCLVAPCIASGHTQIGDRPAILRASDLGVFAEIADQNHLVDATGHDALLLMCVFPSQRNPKHGTKSPPSPPPSRFPTAAGGQM